MCEIKREREGEKVKEEERGRENKMTVKEGARERDKETECVSERERGREKE